MLPKEVWHKLSDKIIFKLCYGLHIQRQLINYGDSAFNLMLSPEIRHENKSSPKVIHIIFYLSSYDRANCMLKPRMV